MQDIKYEGWSMQEFFTGKKAAELAQKMDKRLDEVKAENGEPIEVVRRKVGRNEPCPCGSGTKFKKCHLNKAL